MRAFFFDNPGARGPRELKITLCLSCIAAGQMLWHDLREQPAEPPAHTCGFCGAPPRFCVGCGCSDFQPCEGGCSWVDPSLTDGADVCSQCYGRAMREAAQQQGSLIHPGE